MISKRAGTRYGDIGDIKTCDCVSARGRVRVLYNISNHIPLLPHSFPSPVLSKPSARHRPPVTMFASSQPLTHTHPSHRIHASQTTSKKNTNKENANALPSKTPSRAGPSKLIPSTSTRLGLGVKTVDRNENPGEEGKEKTGEGKEIGERHSASHHAKPVTP